MSEREKPDYEKQFTTVEACEEEIVRLKNHICRKVRERGQVKENKKDAMKSCNDVLKEIEEEFDFSIAVIDELQRHMKLLDAQGGLKSRLQSV